MLDHHDGVGAFWYWRASHNPDCSAGFEPTTLPLLPGPYLPGNLQRIVTEICGADRKSIPR
jgi:hypothetical protein